MGLNNPLRDYSIKPPKLLVPVSGNGLSVQDSADIDFSIINILTLTGELTPTGVTPGTYGDAGNVPQITVDSKGRITGVTLIPISGGGSITADNGLTMSTPTNVRFGGSIIANTVLSNTGFYLRFSQSTGKTLELYSVDEEALFADRALASRNTVETVARIRRRTTTSSLGIWAQSGLGAALDFDLMSSTSSILNAGKIDVRWDSPIAGFETSTMNFYTRRFGVLSSKMSLLSDGFLYLSSYGLGTFVGTPVYALGVTVTGEVIEFPVPSGGGSVTSVGLALNPAPSSPAIQINNSPITTSGDLEIEFLGSTSEYVRGDGSLATLPAIPSPTSVFPYTKRKYYSSGDFRAMSYYNNKLFIVYNSTNVIRIFDTNTSLLVVATAATLPNTSQIIDDIATPEHWATTTGAPPNIIRHDASTGAFIASTPITGVITTAIQSRYASFSATKSIGANTLNIYTIDPTTFVTANLTAHGLGVGFMTYLAINKNVSSLQNGVCMVGGPNGICLFDCNTNTLTLAATNLSGALGAVLDVAYDPINDFWLVANLNAGILQVTALQPASSTTFTIVYNITDVTSGDYTLTGGNAKQICVIPIGSLGQLYVCVNTRFFIYSLITGDALKSDNVDSLSTGALRTTYGLLDESNKRIFFATGVLTNELIYAE